MRVYQVRNYQKPKVSLLLTDQSFGGIRSSINALLNSKLSQEFEFNVVLIGEDQLKVKKLKLRSDVIQYNQASRLKNLPSLVLLKLLNPHSKIIIHEHHYSQGYEQFYHSWLPRFRLMLKLTYGFADQVVAVSQAQGEWMLRNSLVRPDKLTVIQQCVALRDLLDVTPKPIERPFVLAAYGRFSFQKGFDILLQAIKLIPHLPIKLCIGGEGDQIDELQQLAEGLRNIEFVGRVHNIPKFLATSDAVVIPSRWEPWGNVCIEAKAAGKPIIASDVDGLTEQVQNCGLLIPPNDPQALAEAIEHLVLLPETQLKMWGANARESVKEAWERHLNQWRNLLWEVMQA